MRPKRASEVLLPPLAPCAVLSAVKRCQLNEWTGLMQSYEGDTRRTYDEHLTLLRWLDPEHDTRLVRDFALKIRESNQPLYCLWSGRRLRGRFEIDHLPIRLVVL